MSILLHLLNLIVLYLLIKSRLVLIVKLLFIYCTLEKKTTFYCYLSKKYFRFFFQKS